MQSIHIYSKLGCTPDAIDEAVKHRSQSITEAIHLFSRVFSSPFCDFILVRTLRYNLCHSDYSAPYLAVAYWSPSFSSSLWLCRSALKLYDTGVSAGSTAGTSIHHRNDRQHSLSSQQHHNHNETQYRIEPAHDLDNTSPWLKHNRGWSTRTPSPRRTQTIRQSRRRQRAGGQLVRISQRMRAWMQNGQN